MEHLRLAGHRFAHWGHGVNKREKPCPVAGWGRRQENEDTTPDDSEDGPCCEENESRSWDRVCGGTIRRGVSDWETSSHPSEVTEPSRSLTGGNSIPGRGDRKCQGSEVCLANGGDIEVGDGIESESDSHLSLF